MIFSRKSGIILAVALAGLPGMAMDVPTSMPLGYCNGEDTPICNHSDMTPQVWSSGAIFIPSSTAATLAGNKITGIRFGLESNFFIDGAKGWIRMSLDGNDEVVKVYGTSDNPQPKSGWNEVVFDEPWVVPAGCQGFYLGYSLHQKGFCAGIASNSKPCENGLFLNMAETGWKDLCAEGTLFVQAMVEGDNLPGVNLGIASCDMPDMFFMNKESMSGSVQVHNLGALKASSFDLVLVADDKPVATTTVNAGLEPGSSSRYSFEFKPGFSGTGQFDVSVKIANIAEGDDADPLDNERTFPVTVLETAIERMALIEEFSNENCPNCPPAADILHSLMQKEEYRGRVAAVVHHSGNSTDFLTKPWDTDYNWFYNDPVRGAYSPGFMVDRYAKSGNTPVFTKEQLSSAIESRLAEEPVLMLDIEAGFDADDSSKVVVVVKGSNLSSSPVCADPYITLWLTEDDIAAKRQSGASGDFYHQHVARDINSTWGEPVTFEGSRFEYKHVFENVSPNWVKEKLAVVGAVHNVKGDDPTDVAVANACLAPYADWVLMNSGTSVGSISSEGEETEAGYYTLSGIRVNSADLAPGLYIRRSGSKAEKILVK